MIARMWHGRTPRDRADEYAAFLNHRAIPDYRSILGNRAVYILRRDEIQITHFHTVTLWDSLSTIRSFAGSQVERAKHYPEDRGFLLELNRMSCTGTSLARRSVNELHD